MPEFDCAAASGATAGVSPSASAKAPAVAGIRPERRLPGRLSAALRPCAPFLLMSPCAPIPRLPAMVNPMLATPAGPPALQAPAGGARPARSEERWVGDEGVRRGENR